MYRQMAVDGATLNPSNWWCLFGGANLCHGNDWRFGSSGIPYPPKKTFTPRSFISRIASSGRPAGAFATRAPMTSPSTT